MTDCQKRKKKYQITLTWNEVVQIRGVLEGRAEELAEYNEVFVNSYKEHHPHEPKPNIFKATLHLT